MSEVLERVIESTNGKYSALSTGKIINNETGRTLKDSAGTVTLYINGATGKEISNHRVKRLIVDTFKDLILKDSLHSGDNILHLDGNSDNCSIDNLMITGLGAWNANKVYRLYSDSLEEWILGSTLQEISDKTGMSIFTAHSMLVKGTPTTFENKSGKYSIYDNSNVWYR